MKTHNKQHNRRKQTTNSLTMFNIANDFTKKQLPFRLRNATVVMMVMMMIFIFTTSVSATKRTGCKEATITKDPHNPNITHWVCKSYHSENDNDVGCFADNTNVTLVDDYGSLCLVEMKYLNIGDRILDGNGLPTTVTGILHRVKSGEATLQNIGILTGSVDNENDNNVGNDGREVMRFTWTWVTANHIFFNVSSGVDESMRVHPIFAKDITSSDYILGRNGTVVEVYAVTPPIRTEFASVIAPLTESGTILVNEQISASCFSGVKQLSIAYYYTKIKNYLFLYDGSTPHFDLWLLRILQSWFSYYQRK